MPRERETVSREEFITRLSGLVDEADELAITYWRKVAEINELRMNTEIQPEGDYQFNTRDYPGMLGDNVSLVYVKASEAMQSIAGLQKLIDFFIVAPPEED